MSGRLKPLRKRRSEGSDDSGVKRAKTEPPENEMPAIQALPTKYVMNLSGIPPVLPDSIFLQTNFLTPLSKVKVRVLSSK